MKRLLAALFCTTMLVALFGVATAQAEPGPNGNNDQGLCTAYFNGQKKGHDKQGTEQGDSPGPFGALELLADDGNPDNDGDGQGDEDLDSEAWFVSDVFEFCEGLIMGQPEHNGRYDCRTEDGTSRDTDDDMQLECLDNTGDDGTGGDHPSGKDK